MSDVYRLSLDGPEDAVAHAQRLLDISTVLPVPTSDVPTYLLSGPVPSPLRSVPGLRYSVRHASEEEVHYFASQKDMHKGELTSAVGTGTKRNL